MGKRIFDISFALIALLISMPLLLAVAVAVLVNLGRPIFFVQKRAGLHGRAFSLVKFRSMTSEVDESSRLRDDSERLTGFGRWLRSTSLDELPSFWNVLRGDMSVVGPRPLHVAYLSRYSRRQTKRHDVRPGVTGWAQVNGRNSITWGEKFELDVWYVENRSVLLDVAIILRTVKKVFLRDGVSNRESGTMPEFRGDNN